tara:strand:- start:21 stop:182 length:162 start_codon:yes stop_codon:yes gene_type:complete
MTPDEFEAKFREGGAVLTRFHQSATDSLRHRLVFWPLVILVGIGAGTVVWWML